MGETYPAKVTHPSKTRPVATSADQDGIACKPSAIPGGRGYNQSRPIGSKNTLSNFKTRRIRPLCHPSFDCEEGKICGDSGKLNGGLWIEGCLVLAGAESPDEEADADEDEEE